MDPLTATLIIKLIDAGLAITSALSDAGINYREVMDAQDAAKADGTDFDATEFIDQAQVAVDKL